jgi:hypothetical protein
MAFTRAAQPAIVEADAIPPAIRAITILEHCLRQAGRERSLRDLAAMDLRSLALLRQRYVDKPRDVDNYKLLRQLMMVWSTRLAGTEERTFRELHQLIEKCSRAS